MPLYTSNRYRLNMLNIYKPIRKINKSNRYWYKFYIGECPLCGRNKGYKIRMYSKKPKSPQKRIEWISNNETYDYCDGY